MEADTLHVIHLDIATVVTNDRPVPPSPLDPDAALIGRELRALAQDDRIGPTSLAAAQRHVTAGARLLTAEAFLQQVAHRVAAFIGRRFPACQIPTAPIEKALAAVEVNRLPFVSLRAEILRLAQPSQQLEIRLSFDCGLCRNRAGQAQLSALLPDDPCVDPATFQDGRRYIAPGRAGRIARDGAAFVVTAPKDRPLFLKQREPAPCDCA